METPSKEQSKINIWLESFTYGLIIFMPLYFYTTYYWTEASTMPPPDAPWGGKGMVSSDIHPITFYCRHNGEIWKCGFENAFYAYIFGLVFVMILMSPFLYIFFIYKSKQS